MIKTVGCDVDDVALGLTPEWLSRYNWDWNDNLLSSQITSWNIHKFVKPECGNRIYEYLNDPDLYSHVKPMEGAVKGVEILRQLGYRVIFITAYFNTPKIEALHNHGFLTEYPYNDGRWNTACDVVMANDKSLIKADILIDDKHANLESFGSGLIFDQAWNQDSTFPRVYNWNDIVRYFINEKNKELYYG